MASSSTTQTIAYPRQNYDYFLVLDFEATCDNQTKLNPSEIIEFPVLKINGQTFQCESVFHTYVQPVVHRKLTEFCTELTGITQEMVSGQPEIEQVLMMFDQWMEKEGLLRNDVRSIFVTCGDWDLFTMLPSQCKFFNLKCASYFNHWINIKRSFAKTTGSKGRTDMMEMLKILKIPHQGRHHSGIDDCRNISQILGDLARRGHVFIENRKQ